MASADALKINIHGRQLDATLTPSVLTMSTGQCRVRADIWKRLERTATAIAESGGAQAEVKVREGVLATYKDSPLTV
jgi:metal-dependent amidase/aminoacylase/carboxypeptidase family protein